jgi:hypothetical protein
MDQLLFSFAIESDKGPATPRAVYGVSLGEPGVCAFQVTEFHDVHRTQNCTWTGRGE